MKKKPAVHGAHVGLRRWTSLKPKRKAASFRAVIVFAAILLTAGVAFIVSHHDIAESSTALTTNGSLRSGRVVAGPATLAGLLNLTPAQLAQCDIGLMNLICAEGLHGAETLDLTDNLTRLDGIAKHVEFETKRHMHRFRNTPVEFNQSEGYFRMLLMAVTLQEDLGIRYNPERITAVGDFEPNEVFFADCRDVFIHGLVANDRRMGTCSSLPVLYVAVGRRLGYPLKLVPTRNHLFVRWEDSRERFNVDATGRGMNLYDDDHYRQWPMPVSPDQEQEFGYLKSMTATDELTAFLSLRGHCLLVMGRLKEGVEAHEMALRLSPDSRLQQIITAKAKEQIHPQAPPVAYLPPELQDPFWLRPKPVAAQVPGLPGFAPVIPPDPNPLNAVKNR